MNQNRTPDNSKIKSFNLVMWIGLVVNFTVSMLYGYLLYDNYANLQVLYIILPVLWILTFSFLLDGLRRIKKVMNQLSDRIAIFSAFFVQSLMCVLFILG